MAGGNTLRANLAREGDESLELDFRVAKAARNGGFSSLITLHKWPHHRRFELPFKIDDVVWDAQATPPRRGRRRHRPASSSGRWRGPTALSTPSWPCKLGKRRWFHNCIVSPITESGSVRTAETLASELFSTSKAAAVELSTPPLIATAIVITGKLGVRNSKSEIGNWKLENGSTGPNPKSKIQNCPRPWLQQVCSGATPHGAARRRREEQRAWHRHLRR